MAKKSNWKTTVTTTLESLLAQNKDLAGQLSGLDQNVNTVGQVAAQNSPAISAGSARAGLGGLDPKIFLYVIVAVVVGWFVLKKAL